MKAIRIQAYGGAEQMQLDYVPVPRCAPGDVLVRVIAADINPVDWKVRSGAMAQAVPKSFPFVLGQDGAGVVAAVCGEATGFSPATKSSSTPYAEYVAVNAAQVALGPRTVACAAAAALIETAGSKRGQRVLIHGGAVLVQLAERVDTRSIRINNGQEFALADAAQAHRLGEAGKARGKMALHIAAPGP